jgi:hypothetical protein
VASSKCPVLQFEKSLNILRSNGVSQCRSRVLSALEAATGKISFKHHWQFNQLTMHRKSTTFRSAFTKARMNI